MYKSAAGEEYKLNNSNYRQCHGFYLGNNKIIRGIGYGRLSNSTIGNWLPAGPGRGYLGTPEQPGYTCSVLVIK